MRARSPGRTSSPASPIPTRAGSCGWCSTSSSRCCSWNSASGRRWNRRSGSTPTSRWPGSAALVADLAVNKPLGLSPRHIEFKRAHSYDVNPVGLGAMLLACAASIPATLGLYGATAHALAPFLSLGVSFVAAPVIAAATRGRYYLARAPREDWRGREAHPLLHLRTCLRVGGHGALPGLCGADLLALLLARRALPRPLQAPRDRRRPGPCGRAQGPARARHGEARHALRPLRRDLRPGLGRHRRHPGSRGAGNHRRRSGGPCPVARLLRPGPRGRGGGLALRAVGPEPAGRRGRDGAAGEAPDGGDRGPRPHRRRIAARQGGRRGRQRREEPLRRRPEPRVADAAQRHPGLHPASRDQPGRQRQAAQPDPRRAAVRPTSVGPDRRAARHRQDRGRASPPRARPGPPDGVPRRPRRDDPRRGGGQGTGLPHRAPGRCPTPSIPTRSACDRC